MEILMGNHPEWLYAFLLRSDRLFYDMATEGKNIILVRVDGRDILKAGGMKAAESTGMPGSYKNR
jgi:hypothetical protein